VLRAASHSVIRLYHVLNVGVRHAPACRRTPPRLPSRTRGQCPCAAVLPRNAAASWVGKSTLHLGPLRGWVQRPVGGGGGGVVGWGGGRGVEALAGGDAMKIAGQTVSIISPISPAFCLAYRAYRTCNRDGPACGLSCEPWVGRRLPSLRRAYNDLPQFKNSMPARDAKTVEGELLGSP